MKRLILSLTFIFLSSGLFAQESIDGYMKLFSWVKKLDENISSIVRTENQKKLTRQIGYLQADLDNFIDEKKIITNKIIRHCNDSSVTIAEIQMQIEDYNEEVEIIKERLQEIRKTIIFKDDLYLVNETRTITLYRKADSTEMINNHSNTMMQQEAIETQLQPNYGLVAIKDTTKEVTVTKNKNEWKEVDTENLFFEIENSISVKGSNMDYILEEISKGCDIDLINAESEMAIRVLTNIRNEFRNLKQKIRDYSPNN